MKRFIKAAVAAALLTVIFIPADSVTAAGNGSFVRTDDIKSEEKSAVCMVTDRVPGDRAMIPVEVAGKTYYGCCPVCVKRLRNESAVRYSVDPITGKEVDKSTAFIVAGPDRKALYFESKGSALKYRALLSTKRIMQ